MRLKLNENNDVVKVYSDTYTAHIKRKSRDAMSDDKRKEYLEQQRIYSMNYRKKQKEKIIEMLRQNPDQILTLKQLRQKTYESKMNTEQQMFDKLKDMVQEAINKNMPVVDFEEFLR